MALLVCFFTKLCFKTPSIEAQERNHVLVETYTFSLGLFSQNSVQTPRKVQQDFASVLFFFLDSRMRNLLSRFLSHLKPERQNLLKIIICLIRSLAISQAPGQFRYERYPTTAILLGKLAQTH